MLLVSAAISIWSVVLLLIRDDYYRGQRLLLTLLVTVAVWVTGWSVLDWEGVEYDGLNVFMLILLVSLPVNTWRQTIYAKLFIMQFGEVAFTKKYNFTGPKLILDECEDEELVKSYHFANLANLLLFTLAVANTFRILIDQ